MQANHVYLRESIMVDGKKAVRDRYNATSFEFASDKLVYEYFEEWASWYPDRIAICFKDQEMTYRELNEKANQLAHMLVANNTGKNKIIGIMLERSFEMIISIFAVLKSGAAYLPIDPNHPTERIQYYISNSSIKWMLTNKNVCDHNFSGISIFYWDKAGDVLSTCDTKNLLRRTDTESLAYLIYTSGSTGLPKGAMIKHISLLNRLIWHNQNFRLSCHDVLLQKTSYAFDVSVWELLCWAMVGGKLIIMEPGDEKDPRKIVREIEKNRVTMVHFVPSILEMFLDHIETKFDLSRLHSLKYIIASGEELSVSTARRTNKVFLNVHGAELWNLYGPTETTIDVTSYCCNDVDENFERVPIGGPIDNTRLYVFDENMNLCGIEEKGELYIGGIGVAQGYINNSQLTKERFINNPYEPGEKIYMSGDQVSWDLNGSLNYYGRLDSQIKLRGLRIECGEIERSILDIQGIKKAVVLLDDRIVDNKFLVAFYSANSEIGSNIMVDYLKTKLPEYMIPSRFVYFSNIVTTVNGKIDRMALLEMSDQA